MNMLRLRAADVDVILGSKEKKVTESEIAIRRKLRGV